MEDDLPAHNKTQPPISRFSPDITTNLRRVATPDEIAALRQAVDSTSHGHNPWWYLSFVIRIIEAVKP